MQTLILSPVQRYPELVSYLVFYGTFNTNRLQYKYHATEVGNVSHRAGENTIIMQ